MLSKMWRACLLTIVLSVSLSLVATWTYARYSKEEKPSDVLRLKRIELIDDAGNVRATLGVDKIVGGNHSPRLVFLGPDGREAILMQADERGHGILSFSSDYWNSGGVVVGYLGNGGDLASELKPGEIDPFGGFGIKVQGPSPKYSALAVLNNGTIIAPQPSVVASHPH